MNEDQFWHVIAMACRPELSCSAEWADELQIVLFNYEAAEIIEWNHIFDRLVDQAYAVDLWGAAYLIKGGASDDGFYYFRCWLIGKGSALSNPDFRVATLARAWGMVCIRCFPRLWRAWLQP